jgi:hypothetical protein
VNDPLSGCRDLLAGRVDSGPLSMVEFEHGERSYAASKPAITASVV